MSHSSPVKIQSLPKTRIEIGTLKRAKHRVTEESERLYEAAVKLKTSGYALAATVMFRRAISLSPESGILWHGLATTYWNCGDYAAADRAYAHAAELGYSDPLIDTNRGLLLCSMKRYDEAEQFFRDALKVKPDDLNTLWNMSHVYMSAGRWAEGFEIYGSRFGFHGAASFPKMPYPEWNGEDLNGKSILISAEQGSGDRILFSRYIAWLHEKYPGARIRFCPGNELSSIMWKFADFVEFLPDHVPWPKDIDYGCYLLSLPKFHGSTPDNVYPDPGLIRASITNITVNLPPARNSGIRVGVCWTGNPGMQRNFERTIPFPMMLELADNPYVQLYNLQFGENGSIAAHGAGALVEDIVPHISKYGYMGTAAAMLQLDLVITACTSVAHLAGALGIPCWTLLCQDPYWVWLRESDKTPWYPSMRLYRQEDPGDWGPVIDRVKADLSNYAEEKISARIGAAA